MTPATRRSSGTSGSAEERGCARRFDQGTRAVVEFVAMALYFEFKYPQDAILAYGPPGWCIDLKIGIQYPVGAPDDWPDSEIDAIEFEGALDRTVLWPASWQTTYGYVSRHSTDSTITARLPLTIPIIQTIERLRAGTAPLRFATRVKVRARELIVESQPGRLVRYLAGRAQVVNSPGHLVLTVDRDTWVAVLKKIGWSEIEVFEIDASALGDDPAFQEAIGRLRKAQDAFRTRSSPDDVLANCYRALEGIAKVKGSNSVVAGFKTLMEETFPKDERKRPLVNEIIRNVKDFAHFGRHEEVPPVNVSFPEALMILKMTLSLFELMTTNNRTRQD